MHRLSVSLLLSLSSFFAEAPIKPIPATGYIKQTIAGQGQKSSQPAPSPNQETSKPSAPGEVPSDYSKEAFVIEQLRVRFRFENDGTGRRETTARVRIQSEAALQSWGQLRIGYNSANEHLEIPYVRVIKPDGSVVTAGPDAVQELNEPIRRDAPVYTDYREKHVTVPNLRPGDVLEYQAASTFDTPLAPGQFWMQYDFQKNAIVLSEQLQIDLPAARVVKLKTKPGAEPKVSEENSRRIYDWSSSHLVREEPEKSNDAAKNKKKTRPADEIPAVQLTSFANWQEVGAWYAAMEKDRRSPSPAVRAKADELTKALPNDLAKIEALYDYTAKNFRYVSLSLGMGRYQPHAAEEVLRNQYGDCKDKNTLLLSLLEAEGIHASSVLISTTRKLDPEVPSPSQFNHVITMVPLGKDEVWMDTTTEVAPFQLLSYPLRKKQALVISPDGRSPHLEETPAGSPIPDSENVQVDARIDDSGKLDASIAYQVRGDAELVLRQSFRRTASAQWNKIVEGMSSIEGFGKEVTEVKVSDPDATRQPFTLSYRVTKTGYLDPSKKTVDLKLPLSFLGLPPADPDDAENSDPIKLGPLDTHDYHLRVQLPSSYTAHSPVPVAQKRDYASYVATYKLEGNVLTAERTLQVTASELPSSRVQDYLAFRQTVASDLGQRLSVEATTPQKADSSDLKPDDLVKRATEERANGNYALAIDLAKRAVAADPKSKYGWNELGLAYFDSHQDDLAIQAYQAQIAVNPYHQRSYNNLGRVYLRQRQYEQAIRWFNKQIEIDPLDKYAHGNLGFTYLEQHKYQEAIPELEQSASLNSTSAEGPLRLGQAYLNLGQDEKAMASFNQALKLSATPHVWNSIAYQLALKNVHLDLARRYAESAVTTTATALRSFSLEQLSTRNIGETARLASYWDTLGWVEFNDGNLNKSGKYLLAAWQLSSSSDTADHLGQFYEKRGDKERALHYYALSMNARSPDPETRSRLAALAGGNEKVDALVTQRSTEFSSQRTIAVPNSSHLEGKADFFLLFAQAGDGQLTVENTKFASGDEQLKPFSDPLRGAHYSQTLPDETAVKLLRRATLSCTAASDCELVLLLPDDLRSVD